MAVLFNRPPPGWRSQSKGTFLKSSEGDTIIKFQQGRFGSQRDRNLPLSRTEALFDFRTNTTVDSVREEWMFSSFRLSSSLLWNSRVRSCGCWDRGACRNLDRSGIA